MWQPASRYMHRIPRSPTESSLDVVTERQACSGRPDTAVNAATGRCPWDLQRVAVLEPIPGSAECSAWQRLSPVRRYSRIHSRVIDMGCRPIQPVALTARVAPVSQSPIPTATPAQLNSQATDRLDGRILTSSPKPRVIEAVGYCTCVAITPSGPGISSGAVFVAD